MEGLESPGDHQHPRHPRSRPRWRTRRLGSLVAAYRRYLSIERRLAPPGVAYRTEVARRFLSTHAAHDKLRLDRLRGSGGDPLRAGRVAPLPARVDEGADYRAALPAVACSPPQTKPASLADAITRCCSPPCRPGSESPS